MNESWIHLDYEFIAGLAQLSQPCTVRIQCSGLETHGSGAQYCALNYTHRFYPSNRRPAGSNRLLCIRMLPVLNAHFCHYFEDTMPMTIQRWQTHNEGGLNAPFHRHKHLTPYMLEKHYRANRESDRKQMRPLKTHLLCITHLFRCIRSCAHTCRHKYNLSPHVNLSVLSILKWVWDFTTCRTHALGYNGSGLI